jgi:uncharacterized membrane protein YfcA
MWMVTFACGVAFGIAFGLTGVGSVFAVPMLVYAVGLGAHQAVCVAMVSVSSLSALTTALRWRGGEIEFRAGAVLAAMGILGAPLGAWIGHSLSGKWLMVIFACIVTIIGLRMLVRGSEPAMPGARALAEKGAHRLALALAGVATGILAGLLGIGGLLIVPSLVLLGRLEIHRAIATSLPVIFVISVAAISSHFLGGQRVPLNSTALFVVGGALGMIAGTRLGKRLSGQRLRTVFAAAMLAIAAFILVQNLR